VDLFSKQLSVQQSPTQSSRSVAAASQKQQFMLRQHLAKMCFSHQLPYSFTEWEELGACIQDCCLLPSVQMPLPSRRTLERTMDAVANTVKEAIAQDIAGVSFFSSDREL